MLNYLFSNTPKSSDKSAQIAKKRLLQVTISEQHNPHQVNFPALQQDLLKVLLKHYQHIDLERVRMDLTREDGYSILGLDAALPDQPE